MSSHATWVGGTLSTRPQEDRGLRKTDRRKNRGKPQQRWIGAAVVRESEEQRRKKTIALIDRRRNKRRSLAIHFKRRRRGPLKTHHIRRYLSAWEEKSMFLQVTPQIASMSKNLGMLCALIMLACCRYKAVALRAHRREIADWLGIHIDTVTNLTRKLVKRGLLEVEEKFIDATVIGRRGRTLYHPQVGNWYAPGPALRAMWQAISGRIAPVSYPQGPIGVGDIIESMDLNNSLDRKIDPSPRIGSLGSNMPAAPEKVSAARTEIKKPAAPAENSADKLAKLAGPSTIPPYRPGRSSENPQGRAQNAAQTPENAYSYTPAQEFAAGLLHAYNRDPELAETMARAILRAALSRPSQDCELVRPSG